MQADVTRSPALHKHVNVVRHLRANLLTMKKFNRNTFNISTTLVGLLLIPSFLAAWGEDEGTLGTNTILVTLSKLFHVLRFPTHTLLWTLFSESGAAVFYVGLLINCCFYGLVIERLIYFFKEHGKHGLKAKEEVNT